MTKEPPHSKLLNEAARTVLRPLGLTQQGRSRTWIDDNGWWLCVVEFQPSSFSRGSYLNVSCMWLWQDRDDLCFDEGYRIGGFVEFEDPDQFKVVATKFAAQAAAEVSRYRSLFPTVAHVADHYLKIQPTTFWPIFNTAIACGVVGRTLPARKFFAEVLEWGDDLDWVKSAQREAAHLNSIVEDTDAFDSASRTQLTARENSSNCLKERSSSSVGHHRLQSRGASPFA